MSEEIKRCPFCGQRAVIKRHVPKVGYVVQCEFCLAESWGPTQEDAVLSWQRRVQSPAVKALVEAVREYFDPVPGYEVQGQEHYTVTALKAALKRVEEEMR